MVQQNCETVDETTSLISSLEENLLKLQALSFRGCDEPEVHSARKENVTALKKVIVDLTYELNIHKQTCGECRPRAA